jgi:hypothetical protein
MLEKNKETIIIFSEKAADVILEIIKKYGLRENRKEIIERLSKARTLIEKEEIIGNYPKRKLAKLVKGLAEERIEKEEALLILEKDLNLSEEEANGLFNELKNNVLILARKESLQEGEINERKPIKKLVAKEILSKKELLNQNIKKTITKYSSNDSYREKVD